MRNALIVLALVALLAAAGWWLKSQQAGPSDISEFSITASLTLDGGAESLRATPDGTILLYANDVDGSIDIVDISNNAQPTKLSKLAVPGALTALDISPNGRWALATLVFDADKSINQQPNPRLPGGLAIIDLADPAQPQLGEIIGIGHQPVSLAVSSAGADLVAVVAIKNEPVWTENSAEGGKTDISQSGQVQVVTFNPLRQKNYRVASPDLSEQRLAEAGLILPADAQPGFVTMSPDNSQAAVSLQPNGGIDVFDPYWLETRRIFSTGESHSVALSFSPGGGLLFSADGPAGLSVWTTEGELVWRDSSAKPGSSPRSVITVETARFGRRDFALALTDDGQLAVFDIGTPASPVLLQSLQVEPGSSTISALPEQGLLAVSGQSGVLQLLRHSGPLSNDKNPL